MVIAANHGSVLRASSSQRAQSALQKKDADTALKDCKPCKWIEFSTETE